MQNRFDNVRKRSVSDVVQERGDAYGDSRFVRNRIFAAKLIENSGRQMQRAEAVRKARMFRCLIGEMRESELLYPPQALKFSRVNQADKQFSLVRICLEANDIVNRIAVYFFRQVFSPKIFKLNFGVCGKF